MIFDGIGLLILVHKFDGNLKDAIVGWFTRGNFISGSILAYDFSTNCFWNTVQFSVLQVPAKPILNVIFFYSWQVPKHTRAVVIVYLLCLKE